MRWLPPHYRVYPHAERLSLRLVRHASRRHRGAWFRFSTLVFHL